jgi:CRP-like cAMP-binding protein
MTVPTIEPVIRQQSFFSGMQERQIGLITACATKVNFTEGQLIAREGEPAEHFYLVQQGLVAVECRLPQRGVTTIQTVGEGEILGWSWLSPPHRWHFDARARCSTQALKFDGACLRRKCDEDHDLGYEVLRRFLYLVSERLDATRMQMLDIYGNHY